MNLGRTITTVEIPIPAELAPLRFVPRKPQPKEKKEKREKKSPPAPAPVPALAPRETEKVEK
jgi:hypothetical protein